ncbi:nonsense-mediated mRNA decay factor SMG7-like isoform X2 [Lotus japonicus]|uniref:nonsense-mediated mRNA decay factor SMG7-like isoform X2 n=1 Tax=Lotus japonicus TaxID=34305 RepID=UPI00258A7CCB|nr:nonsense-mediated mRNA decay factor SMG7-like isoform X2 [Lotus japonicus]XP_057429985.1 nonsense-mediated mRNA decay factor SMG7-like isoform X2 [Lotus japonicus]
MTTNLSLSSVARKEEVLLEIGNSEKQLWALIHSKGLLHSDVQDLYRKIRSSYERIILNNYTHSELQDVEYSLWKLHYKHIDEFRKIIKKSSGDGESRKSGMPQTGFVQGNNDNNAKLFKLFLSEASEFYQTLIVKLRKHYGVPEEALFYKKGWISTFVEPDVKLKCRYLCHRCLVCMGDLARYKQQCENSDIQNHNWSVAATHYMEATRIWPNSGNPQNQLAVLATYIGDEFLALYHCVRSLAVKEPFPDAWNNIILLFEKNRSSSQQYVSSDVCFDFFKPFGRVGKETKAQLKDDYSNCNKVEDESSHFTDTKLWSLMVRMISFLFIPSSFEEFSSAFASAIGELDKMMELEDIELKDMLESYSQMALARRGPFRAIQVVSILIFSLKNLNDKHEKNESEDKNDWHLLQLAFTTSFIFMGRFIERCLNASSLNHCPLLPSVLVFVEWCSSIVDATEVCSTDQKSRKAISYFFDVFVELLNKLNDNRKETEKLLDATPLWEDYELRGFVPIACSHSSLNFCSNWDHIDNFKSGTELRAERIREAAMKIASRSNHLQKWITCDKLGKQILVARPYEDQDRKKGENVKSNGNRTGGEEPNQQTNKNREKHGKWMTEDNPSSSSTDGKSSVVEEEEEVILFRPLTRYNSAPSYPSTSPDDQISPKDKDDQSLPSDDCLRRATSLLMAQTPDQTQTDPWGFHGSILNFTTDGPLKQQEPSTKESNVHTFSEAPISAGPPSLNAWVLDGGSLSNNRNNGTKGLNEHRLEPIEEIASSLAGLSINNSESLVISSVDESSNFNPSFATYTIPLPSAPLLPENAAWFTDVQSTLSAPRFPVNSSPITGFSEWSPNYGPHGYDPGFPVSLSGYPPPGRMTSSEWLRWYRENHKHNYMQPTYLNPHGNGNHENFMYHDTYRFDQFDRWGNAVPSNQRVYMEPPGPPPLHHGFVGAGEHKASLFNNFQTPIPYGCGGAVTDLRSEPQSLLECLKQKEWRLQHDPKLRGPTFMGD